MRLGIDFGTTRTVVACADRGNYPILTFCDDAGDAHDWCPSLVAERDGELRFGFDALATAKDPSFTAVRSFKRLLADADAGPGTNVKVGSTTIAIDELVTRFLIATKEAVLTRSNLPDELRGTGEDALRSVVAVPANASGAQRFVTLDAFRRAGFGVTAILNEPSAAGFEYTHRHRDTLTTRRDHVVVYDLGGGTFDASLVRMRGRHHDAVTTAGIGRLGGDDFDRVLAELVLSNAELALEALPARARDRLLEQCKDSKERLNPSSRKITIDLEAALGTLAPRAEVTVPVAELYRACMPLVERTLEAMVPVVARMNAASDEVKLDDDVAGIYVVGGASELPIVPRALRERFGRRVHRSPYPSAAIAIGLAIASDEDAGFELSDRYSRAFGVFREGDAGREITFDPIFLSETEIPAAESERTTARRAYRAAHNVGHFRFFECNGVGDDGRPHGDLALFADVLFPYDPSLAQSDLAEVAVRRLPGDGPRIEEAYALDAHGLVEVTVRNLDAGYQRTYRLG
jgi:molecular chaperone DnaK (HSP70)